MLDIIRIKAIFIFIAGTTKFEKLNVLRQGGHITVFERGICMYTDKAHKRNTRLMTTVTGNRMQQY